MRTVIFIIFGVMLVTLTGCVSKQSVSDYTPNVFAQEKGEPATTENNRSSDDEVQTAWRIILKVITVDEMQQLFGMMPNDALVDNADIMVFYTAEKAHLYLDNQKESLRYQALRKKLIEASDEESVSEARDMVKEAMADISDLLQAEAQSKTLSRQNLLAFSEYLFTLAIVEREILNRIQSPLNSLLGNMSILEAIPRNVMSYPRLVGHTKDIASLLPPTLEVITSLLEINQAEPFKPDVETILSNARKL